MSAPSDSRADRIAEIRARMAEGPQLAAEIDNMRFLLDEVERLQGQIDATRQMLRMECAEYDDNDWPDDLHLADVVEKHLARSARAEIERLRAERGPGDEMAGAR